jgi:predicted enzyme related to lactoylglutathione lyase
VASGEPSVFRPGGVSYLRIPAPDAPGLAAFYEAVFGWRLHGDAEQPGFDDATGHVIGHFVADLPVAGDAGFKPYVYVDDVARTIDEAVARGGEIVEPVYPEGNLLVATFCDPAGNVLGVWQLARE